MLWLQSRCGIASHISNTFALVLYQVLGHCLQPRVFIEIANDGFHPRLTVQLTPNALISLWQVKSGGWPHLWRGPVAEKGRMAWHGILIQPPPSTDLASDLGMAAMLVRPLLGKESIRQTSNSWSGNEKPI